MNLEFGVKNSNSKEPVQSTVFEAASLSKPIIAYTALKMCEKGMLDIDKPLRAYLHKSYKDDPLHLSSITLRHILSHTSGFPTSNLKIGKPLRINFLPGSQFCYSGESYRYLADDCGVGLYGVDLGTALCAFEHVAEGKERIFKAYKILCYMATLNTCH